jgi:hypothetical protein
MDLHMDSYSAHYAQCPMPQNLDSFDFADLFDSLLRVFLRILMYGEKVNNFVYFSLPHNSTLDPLLTFRLGFITHSS